MLFAAHHHRYTFHASAVLLLSLLAPARGVSAQGTLRDYERAEQFLSWNAERLVYHDSVEPHWLRAQPGDDRFWYRIRVPEGHAFVFVDPAANVQRPAFDQERLAAELSRKTGKAQIAFQLPFEEIEYVDGGRSLRFWTGEKERWTCDLESYRCTGPEDVAKKPENEMASPDGKWVAFERGENLFVRSVSSGEEIQLSSDGTADWGYAVDPESCCDEITTRREKRLKPSILSWSPDSKKIATYRLDERAVKPLYLIETKEGRPELHTYRVALPGDEAIPTFEVFVFDIERRSQIRVKMEPLPLVELACCGLMADGRWKDVQWSEDGRTLYLTRASRDLKEAALFATDIETGSVRQLVEEKSGTFIELNVTTGGTPNWRVLADGKRALWFSERSGWGHLYLFQDDPATPRSVLTEGSWVVGSLHYVDETRGWVYFTGFGREKDLDPYDQQLYRVRLDGTAIERLTPEDAHHGIGFSPSNRYFIDSFSRRDRPPVTVVRDLDGKIVRKLEEADISKLLEAGWRAPEAFTVKARDGVTDLYGLLYHPSSFDPGKTYPLIVNIYPGPQIGSVGSRAFTAAARGETQALAELGFVVMQLDAMGSPFRSKAFHDRWYGNMGDNGILDQVLAVKQLGARRPYIDLERVGIYGHSGGGFSSTGAILRFPKVFKVAVSTAGNHDNRSYVYSWGEKYQGLLEKKEGEKDGADNYSSQANHLLASNLEGHLLLMYGTLDDNVHPNANLLLVNELIKHNKDFEMLALPNRNHGFGRDPYVIRRTWDHFVRYLLGREPAKGFRIQPPPERPGQRGS